MINKFKNLVNNTSATIFSEKDFEREYKTNLEEKPIDYPSETISNEIKNLLKSLNEGQKRTILNKIEIELVHRYVIYNEKTLEYLQIITIMHDVTGHFTYIPNWDDENWKTIIKLVKNYLNFPNNLKLSEKELKNRYNKEYNHAESVKFLVNKNCKIKIANGDIEFISGLSEIFAELENKIDKFGGINLIFECLYNLPYNKKFKRHIFSRNMTLGPKEVDIPWGYILNLSLKHLRFKHISKRTKYKKLFNEIILLASKIINGVYNLQEYSIWPYFFLDLKNIPKYLSNLVLYDSLFAIPQSNIKLETELCEHLFSFDEDFFEKTIGFTIDDFIKVMNDFNTISKNQNKPIFIKPLKKIEYNMPYDTYVKILRFMSHSRNLNKNYVEPRDYQQINFFEKPLIKIDSNSYLLPSVSWSAPNFFESLATCLREPYKQNFNNKLDDILGEKLEEFIAKLLQKYGIRFIKSGKYKFKGNDAECDFIIENEESIIIIEVKKKVLTRKSKSGMEYSIFIDLAKSLLYSQIQAGKVETLLKKNGKITLNVNEIEKTIYWNNRIIKKISLTQLEYGSLYNHIFIKHFLKSLINGIFRLENGTEEINKEFKKFIKRTSQFQKQYMELNKVNKEDFNYFIHRSYFMSLSQLYEVIKKSHDNKTFDENLPSNLIQQGSFDWYDDYDILNR